MNYCIVFSAQANIKQNVKLKPRGDSAKDLYLCCIQTLTLKPLTLKIYPPCPFFGLTVTVFTQCILLRKEWMGEERGKQRDGGRKERREGEEKRVEGRRKGGNQASRGVNQKNCWYIHPIHFNLSHFNKPQIRESRIAHLSPCFVSLIQLTSFLRGNPTAQVLVLVDQHIKGAGDWTVGHPVEVI